MKIKYAMILLLNLTVFLFFVSCVSNPRKTSVPDTVDSPADLQMYFSPNALGHPEFVSAVNAAKKSINLVMFHLTVNEDINALKNAATRGVLVRVILDGKTLKGLSSKKVFDDLISAGVKVVASSPAFSITHEKSMTIDDEVVFITSENLTSNFSSTRDFGLITHEKKIISEFNRVFEADLKNAVDETGLTPYLENQNLLWSPSNSAAKITSLIEKAQKYIIVYVENFGDPQIVNTLVAAAQKGLDIRIITPLCDKIPDPFYNLPALKKIIASGAKARVMPSPESAETPYIHAKVIIVDGQLGYVGSVNFSNNSLSKAREVGMLFSNSKISTDIQNIFNKDWRVSVPVPDSTTGIRCSGTH